MIDNQQEYILMLTPHEPFQDPRVKWVADLCIEYAPLQIVSSIFRDNQKPETESYSENITIKRAFIHDMFLARMSVNFISLFNKKAPSDHDDATLTNSTVNQSKSIIKSIKRYLQHYLLPIPKFALGSKLHSTALYKKAKLNSHPPKLIICHDLFALPAAVRLKAHYGCPLIYDSHEFWAEAELNPAFSLKNYVLSQEGNLIKHVDTVITVNPQIAGLLQKNYQINLPVAVPNAEPFTENKEARLNDCNRPVRFLLQGRVSPHRGVAELLEEWSQLKNERAVLIIRAPENPYLAHLRSAYRKQVEGGFLIFADPVTEDDLISVASQADIGIIPYIGPNKNHIYACPNKLSQYMQAGLAILYCKDLEFVGQKVEEYNCGLSYNPRDAELFKASIQLLLDNPDKLLQMKHSAYTAAKSDFNWEKQSQGYHDAIQKYI